MSSSSNAPRKQSVDSFVEITKEEGEQAENEAAEANAKAQQDAADADALDGDEESKRPELSKAPIHGRVELEPHDLNNLLQKLAQECEAKHGYQLVYGPRDEKDVWQPYQFFVLENKAQNKQFAILRVTKDRPEEEGALYKNVPEWKSVWEAFRKDYPRCNDIFCPVIQSNKRHIILTRVLPDEKRSEAHDSQDQLSHLIYSGYLSKQLKTMGLPQKYVAHNIQQQHYECGYFVYLFLRYFILNETLPKNFAPHKTAFLKQYGIDETYTGMEPPPSAKALPTPPSSSSSAAVVPAASQAAAAKTDAAPPPAAPAPTQSLGSLDTKHLPTTTTSAFFPPAAKVDHKANVASAQIDQDIRDAIIVRLQEYLTKPAIKHPERAKQAIKFIQSAETYDEICSMLLIQMRFFDKNTLEARPATIAAHKIKMDSYSILFARPTVHKNPGNYYEAVVKTLARTRRGMDLAIKRKDLPTTTPAVAKK